MGKKVASAHLKAMTKENEQKQKKTVREEKKEIDSRHSRSFALIKCKFDNERNVTGSETRVDGEGGGGREKQVAFKTNWLLATLLVMYYGCRRRRRRRSCCCGSARVREYARPAAHSGSGCPLPLQRHANNHRRSSAHTPKEKYNLSLRWNEERKHTKIVLP